MAYIDIGAIQKAGLDIGAIQGNFIVIRVSINALIEMGVTSPLLLKLAIAPTVNMGATLTDAISRRVVLVDDDRKILIRAADSYVLVGYEIT